MEILKRFRWRAARWGMLSIGVAAILALLFSGPAAIGVLAGGTAGVAGFWVLAIRIEKLVTRGQNNIKFASFLWLVLRYALYAVAVWLSYRADRESLHGVIGAVVGLLLMQILWVVLGITGRDQREHGRDR